MSADARSNVNTDKKLLGKFTHQPFFKLIIAVLIRMKNMWSMQNALSGIQIYGDMED